MTGCWHVKSRRFLAIAVAFTISTEATVYPQQSATARAAESPASPRLRRSEAPATTQALTPAFFVGVWEARVFEHGRDLRIQWTLRADGTLDYVFEVDGIASRGSTGSWRLVGREMHESWLRPDGTRDQGRGTVERIDDQTIKLTIADNGDPAYTGFVRIYRRLGPPQLVEWKITPQRLTALLNRPILDPVLDRS